MTMTDQTMRILPEVILAVAGTLIMVLSPIVKRARVLGYLALLSLGIALGAAFGIAGDSGTAFSGQILNDGFGIFFRVLFILIGALVILTSFEYLEREGIETGEFYALVLMSVVGQGLMACSVELVMIFIALEISSISTYILCGYRRADPRGVESALKYFLLGSFATGFLLYGIALIFGATGSTNLHEIRTMIQQVNGPLVGMAAALMFVGLAFKVSGAPFQVWTPDVYEGAPTPVTALMSAGPKAAAFAIFLRIFLSGLTPEANYFWLLWTCAALSMFVGNLAALVQTNIKRMLAYSSIAHAGYVLAAFTARSVLGVTAAMFYLAAYCAMNIGTFLVVTHLSGQGETQLSIRNYRGLGRRRPMLAACLTVFMLSLIGIPLTGGFFGKFYIVTAIIDARLPGLAVIMMINSAIAAYYYLRVVVTMYMEDQAEADAQPATALGAAAAAVLVLTLGGVFYLGISPDRVLTWAAQGANIFK
jgi:NADH-quinone oxidoreductase subunit N